MTLDDIAGSKTTPNVEVRPLGTGASVLITADGRLFEIDKPPDELLRALDDLVAHPDQHFMINRPVPASSLRHAHSRPIRATSRSRRPWM